MKIQVTYFKKSAAEKLEKNALLALTQFERIGEIVSSHNPQEGGNTFEARLGAAQPNIIVTTLDGSVAVMAQMLYGLEIRTSNQPGGLNVVYTVNPYGGGKSLEEIKIECLNPQMTLADLLTALDNWLSVFVSPLIALEES